MNPKTAEEALAALRKAHPGRNCGIHFIRGRNVVVRYPDELRPGDVIMNAVWWDAPVVWDGRQERRYGVTQDRYEGIAEDVTRCIEAVWDGDAYRSRQCIHERGHGPDGLYCEQHADGIVGCCAA